MSHTDLMIDLETLGTAPGSVITQIGLCAFDAETESATVAKRIDIDPQSCLDYGMHVSWDTIKWWLQQNEEARICMAFAVGYPLSSALVKTIEFIEAYCAKDVRVWGNGSCFDVVLLEDAFRRRRETVVGGVPWGFRNIRDMRTLAALFPGVERVKPRIAHDACADAQAQALTVQKYYAALRRTAAVE